MKSTKCRVSTIAIAVAIATGVHSQTPSPTGAATEPSQAEPAAQDAPNALSDIIVTAQRRSENLQRAALAVSAVSGDALVSAGVTRPTELSTLVPALQIAPASGPYSLFYLRGVGNFNGNALSDTAVAFNVDGVYVGRPSSTTGFFYDLDRVEVLKGPQGTLYGRNATGGAINVITHKADLGRTEGAFSAEYGNYDALRLDGTINLPVGQDVALRAAGIYARHDGYMRDGTDNQDDLGGRVSLHAAPTGTLTIDVVADAFRQRGRGVGGTPVELGVEDRPGFQSAAGQAFMTAQPNVLDGRTFAALSATPYQRNDYWGISSTIAWSTSLGTLTVVPAYREGKLDYLSATPGFYIKQREKDRQGSLEARLASSDDHPLRYLLGAFYYNETNDVPQFYVNQQSNVNVEFYKQHQESAAAFGRLTYAVTPEVRFNVGGRYTHETKHLDGVLRGALLTCVVPTSFFPTYVPGCPTAQPFPVNGLLPAPNFNPMVDGTLTIPSVFDTSGANARDATFNRFTYRVGADWDITPRNLLYASYETGFKSGGFFFTSDSGVFRPESIAAWTIGSKNRFLDNRLQLNLEGFYWRYKDQQISHLLNDSSGSSVFATENVGRATYKGVEAEMRFLLTRTTEVNADVQYLDARYGSFVYQTPNRNGGISNGTSCPNAGAPGTSYTVDCSGKTPPYAPRWTVNLGAQQTVPLASGAKVTAGVRSHYQGRTLTGLEFIPPEYQARYWQVDAQITFTAPESRFTIGAFANNVFDKTVIANTFPVPFSLFTAASLRPPRLYGVRAGVRF